MIASLTHKYKLVSLAMLLASFSHSVLASSVRVSSYQTEGNRVTLKVQVLNSDNVPVPGLKRPEFNISTIDETGEKANPDVIEVISPEQSRPDPARVIILLDMSGSMKQRDANNVKKLDGAIAAIRQIIQQIRQQRLPYKIAIVPFGYGCRNSYEVNAAKIEKKLTDITDNTLDRQLDELAKVEICAATNLYDPLQQAVRYLVQSAKVNPESSDTGQPPPKLAVILLSDGYHIYDRNREGR